MIIIIYIILIFYVLWFYLFNNYFKNKENFENINDQLTKLLDNKLKDIPKYIMDVIKKITKLKDSLLKKLKNLVESLFLQAEAIAKESKKNMTDDKQKEGNLFSIIKESESQMEEISEKAEKKIKDDSKILSKMMDEWETDIIWKYEQRQNYEIDKDQKKMNDDAHAAIIPQYDKALQAKENLKNIDLLDSDYMKTLKSKDTSDAYLTSIYNKYKSKFIEESTNKNNDNMISLHGSIESNLRNLETLSYQIEDKNIYNHNNQINNYVLDSNNNLVINNHKINRQILEKRKLISDEILGMIKLLRIFKTHVDNKNREFNNLNDDLAKKNKFIKTQINNAYRKLDEIEYVNKVNDCKLWKYNKEITSKQMENARKRDCKVDTYNKCLNDNINNNNYERNTNQNENIYNELIRKFPGIYYDIVDSKWKL